jgi:hypothetical protein
MDTSIRLRIEFSRHLNAIELTDFLRPLVNLIEEHHLKISGTKNSAVIDWTIDLAESNVEKGEIIDWIGAWLLEKDEMILNFAIN